MYIRISQKFDLIERAKRFSNLDSAGRNLRVQGTPIQALAFLFDFFCWSVKLGYKLI